MNKNTPIWIRTFRALLTALAVLAGIVFGILMMAASAHAQGFGAAMQPQFDPVYNNANGAGPAALGYLCSFAAGTTTPQATYTDDTLNTPNQNPIRLSAGGRPVNGSSPVSIFLSPVQYKFNLYANGTGNTCNGTSVGALIRSVDNVYDVGALIQAGLVPISVLNNRVYCPLLSLTIASIDAAFTSAAAKIPSTGGIIDCSNIQGTPPLNSDTFHSVTKPILFIWPSGTTSGNASFTMPANITSEFIQGGIVSMATATTATFIGEVRGTQSEHFAGSGAVLIEHNQQIYPQWWGALGDNSNDDTSAINSALNSLPNGGTVYLPTGKYKTTGAVAMQPNVNLKGAGGNTAIIEANSTNGITFSFFSGVQKLTISGIGVNGAAGTTFHGIYQPGDDVANDQLYGVTIGPDVYINNFNVAIQAKNSFFWTLDGIWAQNVNSCILLLGQDLDWHIEDTRCVFASGNGSGNSYGIQTDYATFNGGMTSIKPEGIEIHHSKFFGFTTIAAYFNACIQCALVDSDTAGTTVGIEFGEVAGVLKIDNVYTQMNGTSSTHCIFGKPQSGPNPVPQIVLANDTCITDGTSIAADGVNIDNTGGSNQNHIVISNLNSSTFPGRDIALYGVGSVAITGSSLYSTGNGSSVYVDSTTAGQGVYIHDNYFKGNVKAGGSQRAQIYVGPNGGTFSTAILSGQTVVAAGTTAGVSTTTAYSSLYGSTGLIPSFDTQANTGFQIRASLDYADGLGVGVCIPTATATQVSWACSSAPMNNTNLYWRVQMIYPNY